jgi:hypothetical protein
MMDDFTCQVRYRPGSPTLRKIFSIISLSAGTTTWRISQLRLGALFLRPRDLTSLFLTMHRIMQASAWLASSKRSGASPFFCETAPRSITRASAGYIKCTKESENDVYWKIFELVPSALTGLSDMQD